MVVVTVGSVPDEMRSNLMLKVVIAPGAVLAGLVKKIDRSVTVASVEDPAGLEAVLAAVSSEPRADRQSASADS